MFCFPWDRACGFAALLASRAKDRKQLEACSNHRYIAAMRNGRHRTSRRPVERVELGEYIVADPEICHGKPTFKGTRIMVWQVLDALSRGESAAQIVKAWDGKVGKAAIAETVRLARQALLDDQGRLCNVAGSAVAA
ncbi:MAG: hypothetical protein QOJ40_601 [Verrucomicrobiota bacterium]